MLSKAITYITSGVFLAATLFSCKKDIPVPCIECIEPPIVDTTKSNPTFNPTPYEFDIPSGFPDIVIPVNNPMTVEGIELGKKLFYDNILSGDQTQSCSSCHLQSKGFSDPAQFSTGIDGLQGNRNASNIVNAVWSTSFFWDGRAATLEDQALGPVPNPIEMHLSWKTAIDRLNSHETYPDLFYNAFGVESVDSTDVAKAIAQFERTFISVNSKFDKYIRDEVALTQDELAGFIIFGTEKGDCFHCHGTENGLMTDNLFHNNGLDANLDADKGLYNVTGDANHIGLFKTPTLRNIEYTAPYMHDGRFSTLEEVIDHYSDGLVFSNTIDPLMKKIDQGGLLLTIQEKAQLVAFLKTFSEPEFITNEAFSNPN